MSVSERSIQIFYKLQVYQYFTIFERTILYSYLVGCCPLSDLFGNGEPILGKRKLSPISVLSCQINQISGKQLTKQPFYYSRPES